MGGEFTSLFKEERQAAAEGLPANSFAKTLKPEDQIAYLTQREDIKTKAARYLKTQDAKDQLAREKAFRRKAHDQQRFFYHRLLG